MNIYDLTTKSPSAQLERRRSRMRFENPSIDPNTGERLRRLTPVENYQMTAPSAWAVRF